MKPARLDIGAAAVEDSGAAIPDQRLAAAVLQLAVDDLQGGARAERSGTDEVGVLQESRRFCFSNNAESKRWREFWCELAGVEVAYFQRMAAQLCR